jgi:hypothetical protein
MINKEYWDEFYSKNELNFSESDFARYTLGNIKNKEDVKLIDVACGDGRDTKFFSANGIDAKGIDLSADLVPENFKYEKSDLLTYDYNGYNIIYLRFVVHSLTETEFEQFINKLKEINNDYTLFIETRSSKGITDEPKSDTFFKSSIGKEHFRLLYSKEYLDNKLNQDFEIIESIEDIGFSSFNGDNPYCIRYIVKNKKV